LPISSVLLRPGINTEYTATLNEAGYSQSQLIRWMSGLVQKIGGWVKFYAFQLAGVPRALHAWLDFNQVQYLGVGLATGGILTESGGEMLQENGYLFLLEATGGPALAVITGGTLTDITPQQKTTNFNPNAQTTASSAIVTITDGNISNITTYDSIFLNTPISVGGLILSGQYPVTLVLGATSYEITAASNATTTRENLTISNITQANPGVVTYTGSDDIANADLVYIYGVGGMVQVNGLLFTVANLNTGANTFELSGVDTTAYTAYTSGGTSSPSHVPQFTTTSGSATVTVKFQGHGLSVGSTINFPIATTVGGVTILGTYPAASVTDTNTFTITANAIASSSATASMNSGQFEIVYNIALGPIPAGTGYSIGTYSSGGYSTGATITPQQGTAITASDWSLANWGATLLANPRGGGIYAWTPGTGLQNAQLISSTNAPYAVNSIFVAMPAQILVALGASSPQNIGSSQNPLRVQWSDQLNYNQWVVSSTTQAGSFTIPTGSRIVGGLQGPQNALLWTDLDLWAMQYIGYPLVFGFNKVGSNCGLIAPHAKTQVGTGIFWMSLSNFFVLTGGGATPIPCPVWDAVFQNIDTNNLDKCWAWPSSTFNEVWFFYPSANGTTGECDSYVKLNVVEGAWDYGTLPRSIGIDESILGTPIAATPTGLIYQHEQGEDADGAPLSWSWQTGFWTLEDGTDIAFVDWLFPDFEYALFSGGTSAQLSITFYSRFYPNGTTTTYGPYLIDNTTQFINPRIRGREMAMAVSGSDVGSFSRLGRLRLRAAPDGKL